MRLRDAALIVRGFLVTSLTGETDFGGGRTSEPRSYIRYLCIDARLLQFKTLESGAENIWVKL